MSADKTVVEIENVQKLLKENENSAQNYLFNLIVFSPNKERSSELKTILAQVTEKFPCRIIHIEKIQDRNLSEVKVSLSKEKFGKVGAHVLCDTIHIYVSESELGRVPFLILPNIVADLPVYLIWGEDPTMTTETLKALQGFSTRLIFNTAWIDHIQDFSRRMLDFLKDSKIDAVDITWGSLSSWRDLLAEVFETEEKVKQLQTCKKMVIGFQFEKEDDLLEAIYLQGFIASRMGWKLTAQEIQHDHQKALCYQFQGKDINVILDPIRHHQGKNGSIMHVEVTAQDDTVYKLITCKNSKVVLHVSSCEQCEMPCTFALTDLNRGINFLKEIFYQFPCERYKEMLEMISKVNWES